MTGIVVDLWAAENPCNYGFFSVVLRRVRVEQGTVRRAVASWSRQSPGRYHSRYSTGLRFDLSYIFTSKLHQRMPSFEIEFFADVQAMLLDRAHAHQQFGSDFFVRFVSGNQF